MYTFRTANTFLRLHSLRYDDNKKRKENENANCKFFSGMFYLMFLFMKVIVRINRRIFFHLIRMNKLTSVIFLSSLRLLYFNQHRTDVVPEQSGDDVDEEEEPADLLSGDT